MSRPRRQTFSSRGDSVRSGWRIGLCVMALGCLPPASRATCSLSSTTPVAFGSVSSLNNATPTTGTVTGQCTALQTGQVGLNQGLGVGAGTSIRYLTGPGGTEIPYNLYTSLLYTNVWGNTSNTVGLVGLGATPVTLTVYAQIAAGTTIPVIGTFTDTITVTIYVGGASVGTAMLTVTLTTVGSCTVAGGTLIFGSGSLLNSNFDGSGTFTATCTNTAPYSIGLDNGQNFLSGRRMTDSLTHYIGYQLYTDAGRSNPWTTAASNAMCTTASSCVLGTGNGATQTITVYGRVPPQSGPIPGIYSDTVLISVTY